MRELREAVGPGALISDRAERGTYQSDGLKSYVVMPGVVVLPASAEQVAAVVRACHRGRVPFVARGSGTGLSGGALPVEEGVLIVLTRMNRILHIDAENRIAVVEPGVTNLAVSEAAAPLGYYYAPDPSSQIVCSIGGNVAENSGGAHCLKYGFTTHHVLGLEVVLPDGKRVSLGARRLARVARLRPGWDVHRLGGDSRCRDEDLAAAAAQARGGGDAARRVRLAGPGRSRGVGDRGPRASSQRLPR